MCLCLVRPRVAVPRPTVEPVGATRQVPPSERYTTTPTPAALPAKSSTPRKLVKPPPGRHSAFRSRQTMEPIPEFQPIMISCPPPQTPVPQSLSPSNGEAILGEIASMQIGTNAAEDANERNMQPWPTPPPSSTSLGPSRRRKSVFAETWSSWGGG